MTHFFLVPWVLLWRNCTSSCRRHCWSGAAKRPKPLRHWHHPRHPDQPSQHQHRSWNLFGGRYERSSDRQSRAGSALWSNDPLCNRQNPRATHRILLNDLRRNNWHVCSRHSTTVASWFIRTINGTVPGEGIGRIHRLLLWRAFRVLIACAVALSRGWNAPSVSIQSTEPLRVRSPNCCRTRSSTNSFHIMSE